jgi:hypothetical protein
VADDPVAGFAVRTGPRRSVNLLQNADPAGNPVSVECAITADARPLTIADLPDWLLTVLEPVYDPVLPALLGGDPVTLHARRATRYRGRRTRRGAGARTCASYQPRHAGPGARAGHDRHHGGDRRGRLRPAAGLPGPDPRTAGRCADGRLTHCP